MSDPLIRSCDHYVVLEPGKEEQILSLDQTLQWLQEWLKKIDCLPADLKDQPTHNSAAKRLIETACELEIHPGFNVQWFAVRLDHPGS